VHIIFLVGFRNRFLVLFEWAGAYLTWRRGGAAHHGALERPGLSNARSRDARSEPARWDQPEPGWEVGAHQVGAPLLVLLTEGLCSVALVRSHSLYPWRVIKQKQYSSKPALLAS
jgi:hypothetical protein